MPNLAQAIRLEFEYQLYVRFATNGKPSTRKIWFVMTVIGFEL